ncbi:RNA polymerase factor sigma-54 [Amphibiibacter pelophylacis]|uniref:RNA polymerase factor sigma-54 n=1 Tax=Amphibiibacter pelophylacis TaxID=1799477 RepID=A0ACC6P345_9BURK
MKPSLQVRTATQLTLTPQLTQGIRLLQLSALELQQELAQAVQDNPFLELELAPGIDAPDAAPSAAEAAAEVATDTASDPGTDRDGGDGEASAALDTLVSFDAMGGGWDGDSRSDERQSGGGGDGPDEAYASAEAPLPAAGDDAWLEGLSAYTPGQSDDDDEGDGAAHSARGQPGPTLAEHLRGQVRHLRLSRPDAQALLWLIDALNDDGYLTEPLDELAQAMAEQFPPDEVDPDDGTDDGTDGENPWLPRLQCALGWLHSLEPAGVGARDLAECLVLQLREAPRSPEQALAVLLCRHLDAVGRRDWKKLAALTGTELADVQAAAQLIRRCEPKPGRRFADVQAQVVVPDVIVRRSRGALAPSVNHALVDGWLVALNPAVMPRVRVNEQYAQWMRPPRGERSSARAAAAPEASAPVSSAPPADASRPDGAESGAAQRPPRPASMGDCLQEARWLVRNVQQRFDTLLRVAQAIVHHQAGFFEQGQSALRPLVLREIAAEVGLHESTVSRVTSGKYMQTPHGTVELKFFFSSSLAREDGGEAMSSTAVRQHIARFIAAEDPQRPLSDSQLAAMLGAEGIQVARRTVAKYREALKIPVANLRRPLD